MELKNYLIIDRDTHLPVDRCVAPNKESAETAIPVIAHGYGCDAADLYVEECND